jgi:small basic protein
VALVAVAVFGRLSSSYQDLVGVVVLVDGCLFAVLLAISLVSLREPAGTRTG